MKLIRILLLEDDLDVISAITGALATLEETISPGREIGLTTYSTHQDVRDFVNPQKTNQYDLILLDRDCKLGGSFHAIDFEKFGPQNMISISSGEGWNVGARERGVKSVVWKNYDDIPMFIELLIKEIKLKLRI